MSKTFSHQGLASEREPAREAMKAARDLEEAWVSVNSAERQLDTNQISSEKLLRGTMGHLQEGVSTGK